MKLGDERSIFTRRSLIRSVAGASVIAAAGCAGDDDEPSSDGFPSPEGDDDEPEEEETPADSAGDETPTPEPPELSEDDIGYNVSLDYDDAFLEEGDQYQVDVEVERILEDSVDEELEDEVEEGLLAPDNYSLENAYLNYREFNEEMEITETQQEINPTLEENSLIVDFEDTAPGQIWIDLELQIKETIEYGENQELEIENQKHNTPGEAEDRKTGYIEMPWKQKQQHLEENLNQIGLDLEEAFFQRRQKMRNQIFEEGDGFYEQYGNRLDEIDEQIRDLIERVEEREVSDDEKLEELFDTVDTRYSITASRWIELSEDIRGGGDTSADAAVLAWTLEEFYEDTWAWALNNQGHNTVLAYNIEEDKVYNVETSGGNATHPPGGALWIGRNPDKTPLHSPEEQSRRATSTLKRKKQLSELNEFRDRISYGDDFRTESMEIFEEGESNEEMREKFAKVALTNELFPPIEVKIKGSPEQPEIVGQKAN